MGRAATLIFAILAYAVFFATFLYLIVFVGDFSFASRTVDLGPPAPVEESHSGASGRPGR